MRSHYGLHDLTYEEQYDTALEELSKLLDDLATNFTPYYIKLGYFELNDFVYYNNIDQKPPAPDLLQILKETSMMYNLATWRLIIETDEDEVLLVVEYNGYEWYVDYQ